MNKPFLIWFSIILSGLMALYAGAGLLRVLLGVGSHAFLYDLVAMLVQGALLAYLVIVLYGLIQRPRWGRALSVSLALVTTALLVWNAIHPGPNAPLKITPDEQGGALAGRILMVLLGVSYIYKMALGSTPVRRYFDPLPPRRLGEPSGHASEFDQTLPD